MTISLRQFTRPQTLNVPSVLFSGVITSLKTLLKLSLVCLPFVPCFVKAVGTQEFQSGSQFGAALINQGMGGDLKDIFGAPSQNPQESTYAPAELKERGQARSKGDPTTDLIMETRDNGMKFTIDTANDPLIVRSNQIYENDLTEIGGKGTKVVRVEKKKSTETATCEESGDPAREVCHGNLHVVISHGFEEKETTRQIVINNVIQSRYKAFNYWAGQKCSTLQTSLMRLSSLGQSVYQNSERRRELHRVSIGSLVNSDVTQAYKACLTELRSHGGEKSYYAASIVGVIPLSFSMGEWIDPAHIVSVKVPEKSSKDFLHEGSSRPYEVAPGQFAPVVHMTLNPVLTIRFKVPKYETKDEWLWACDELEGRADKGICQYENEECTSGQQTRVINGVKVTRPCWEMKRTYLCSYPSKNDCGPLRAQGCHQIKSTCKKWVGKTCVVHTQTYQCESDTESGNIERIEGPDVPFCLDGNCVDQSWKTNNEIGDALAQLSLLKELQGQFKKDGLSIFTGSDNRCKKEAVGFKDCCKDNGWGPSMGLASCSENERLLAQRKQDKLCHFVGTYCDKKVLGKCIVKKSSYCCFGSKLSRIFHEQGRSQIGLSWGDGKNPVCRGFTLEEIQRIDFSKLDLSEVYEEILKRYKSPDPKVLNHKIQERMKVIQDSITPMNRKNPPPQREEA